MFVMMRKNHCMYHFKGKVKVALNVSYEKSRKPLESPKTQNSTKTQDTEEAKTRMISIQGPLSTKHSTGISTSTVGLNQSPQTDIRAEIMISVCQCVKVTKTQSYGWY